MDSKNSVLRTLWITVAFLSFTNVPGVSGIRGSQNSFQCERLSIQLCKGLSYDSARFPNYFHQGEQNAAGLELHQFSPLVSIGCAAELKEFLCRVYAPECGSEDENMARVARLCPAARDGCLPVMRKFGFDWPESLDCGRFSPASKCAPITSTLCQGIGYTDANLTVDELNKAEAQNMIARFLPLIQNSCSGGGTSMKEFICRLYAPECADNNVNEVKLYELCPVARSSCEPILMEYHGFTWPERFECDNFPSPNQCHPLNYTRCEGLGYNNFQLPNLLNMIDVEEIHFAIGRFLPLVDYGCGEALKTFMCRMYLPECNAEDANRRIVVETCPAARRGCETVMRNFGFAWPDQWSCSNFN